MDQIIASQLAEQTALKGRIQAWLHANRATADGWTVELNETALVACCREIEQLRAKEDLGICMPSAQRNWA